MYTSYRLMIKQIYLKRSRRNLFLNNQQQISRKKVQMNEYKSIQRFTFQQNQQLLYNMSKYYQVQRIVGRRIESNGQVIYKVKWKGYSENECTWEPISNLKTVQKMVEEFNQNREQMAKNSKNMAQMKARPNENHRSKQSLERSTSSKDKRKQPKLQGESQETKKLFKKNEKQKNKEMNEASEHENYLIEEEKDIQLVEDFGASVNISFLEQRINQLVRQKEEDDAEARIVNMRRGDNIDEERGEIGHLGVFNYVLNQFVMFSMILINKDNQDVLN